MRVRSPQRPSQNAEQTSGPACIKNACAPLKTGAQCVCLSIAYMYSFYYFGALLPHAHPSPRHPHPGFRTGRTAMMPRIETRRRALPSVCGAAAPLAKYVIEV